MATFDLYKDGKVDQEGVASPITITGLKPETTYSGYSIAYAGKPDKTIIADFKTQPAPVVKMTSFKIDNLESAGKVGENVKFTLSDITPADTTNKGVDIWVDDTEVATVASNDGNTFTVNLVKKGTTGIHWLAKDGGGAKADGTVTVKDPAVAVTGVKLDKTELSVEEGATAQLKATVAPGNATNKKVAWKSGNPETFTIDGNGKVTGVKAGSATAVATTDDGGKTAEAKVTVTAKPEPEPDPEEPAE